MNESSMNLQKPSALNGFHITKLNWRSFSVNESEVVAPIVHRRLIRKTKELLNGFAGKSVLELGPREGSVTKLMSAEQAGKILAVEPVPNNYLKLSLIHI